MITAALLLTSAAAAAPAAQVAVSPAVVYLNPAGRGYSDLVVHNIGVRAGTGAPWILETVRIELLVGGEPAETRTLSARQMVADTADLLGAPVPAFVEGQLLSPDGLSGLFKAKTIASRTTTLAPGSALVTTRHYFATRVVPESVRITAQGQAADGQPLTASALVPVRKYNSTITYQAPLAGTWLMQAIATLQSHHRFNAPTEFAVDFMKVDGEGRLYHGDVLKADSFFGYGASVMAAADGVVVRVVDGAVQDRAAMTRRPDETPQAAGQRIGMFSIARMKADFVRAVAGNLVTIRHQKDGATEYSSYGHLRPGIAVREGQAVKAGDLIGHVGDTGDSATVHLHFEINAGADPFRTESLPVAFSNLKPVGGNSELGRFVAMAPPPAPPASPAG
jgi:murein DD-endopeptidase MepM/ murein hydrolase activator NlpD